MKKFFALVLMLPFMIAAGDGDCGSSSGCSGATEPCPEQQLSGVWIYQRNVDGGMRQGGATVTWMMEFKNFEPGRVRFSLGNIKVDADILWDVIWRHEGDHITADYTVSDDGQVTFWFNDMLNPQRTSFSGQLVQGGINGNGATESEYWLAQVCNSSGNCVAL